MADAEDTPQWRTVEGFPNYEVSDDGRVRSYTGPRGELHAIPTVLAATPDVHGYRRVTMRHLGKMRQEKVARLVLLTFAGPPPFPRAHAAHRDGDRLNNRLTNLYWATSKQNNIDKITHGTIAEGERHGRAMLTTEQVRTIRAEYKAGGISQKALARKYGVANGTIWYVVKNLHWDHV